MKKLTIYVLHATGFDDDGEEMTHYVEYDKRWPEKRRALANMKAYREMGITSTLYVVEADLSKAKRLRSLKGKTEAQRKRDEKKREAEHKAARARFDAVKVTSEARKS